MKTSTLNQINSGEMIVFSHLRWEFVKQRPQHIIERFAKTHSVLFVEEPVGQNPQGSSLTAHEIFVSPTITVIQPSIDRLDPAALSTIISAYMNRLKMKKPLLWFYSAAFVDVLEMLPHGLVIYDCMDELTAFLGAPKELVMKEKELLQKADVVFTGGHSLYEAKRKLRSHVYNFPSSVDQKHFAIARKKNTQIPKDLTAIPRPIAGFYGVLDERLDIPLLSYIANQLPGISIVLIGPVVKIDPDSLPKQTNIYYLGPKTYHQLPFYLKGFDMAIMPFARNNATRFISPTKTLEFMAAGKPVISTPIHDVIHDFSTGVTIANNKKDFAKAMSFYIKEPLFHKLKRQLYQKTLVKRTSWNQTVMEMREIIEGIQKSSSPALSTAKGYDDIVSPATSVSYL